MRTVHKFELRVDGKRAAMDMNATALIKHVGVQPRHNGTRGVVQMWAEVETDSGAIRRRYFEVIGTGHPVPAGGVYVGTALDGPFVWHVYEMGAL